MTTKKKATKATSTKSKAQSHPAPKRPPIVSDVPGTDEPGVYAGFESGDRIQVSENGATWSDFDTLNTPAEAQQAQAMCELTGVRQYRIVGSDQQTVKVAPSGTRTKPAKPTKPTKTSQPKPAPVLDAEAEVEATMPEANAIPVTSPNTIATTPSTPKKQSALDAAAQVLAESGTAMNCQELVAAMREQGLWASPGGKTPHSTLHAAISTEIRKHGETARFAKSTRGKFTLRSTTRPATPRTPTITTQATPTAPGDDTPADGPESMSELFRLS